MSKFLGIIACVVAICVVILAVGLNWGVWLPDTIKPTATVLDEIITPEDGHLRLTQLWVGDGYATEFFHTDKSGAIWTFAVDGDAKKAWKARLRRTNNLVNMHILGKQFAYNLQTHVVTARDGEVLMVEEFPRGTPIVPPR